MGGDGGGIHPWERERVREGVREGVTEEASILTIPLLYFSTLCVI